MEVNLIAVLAASVAMFIVGAIWYMPIFGKMWGEMFGFDKLSKKEQKEMQSKMGPYYLLQITVTILTAFVLARAINALPDVSPYQIAFCTWLGFMVPTTVSGVIFGGVDTKWIPRRILITIGGSLVTMLVGAFVISLF